MKQQLWYYTTCPECGEEVFVPSPTLIGVQRCYECENKPPPERIAGHKSTGSGV